MEESDLLKKRVQAITEKHHIQQLIRKKKVELDQEKVKLQHLKKKALREQWMLQDSASHTFQKQHSLLSDQQQTRALQLQIHSIEMDIYYLEREESRISTNEKLILNRLKAVEKSPQELIRDMQDSFVPEPLQITKLVPESNTHSEINTSRKSLCGSAMEVNTKHFKTGQNTEKGTQDVSDLSASEVEQSLKSVAVHRYVNHHQNLSHLGHYFYEHNDERQYMQSCGVKIHGMEKWQEQSQHEHDSDNQKSHYSRQEERNNHSSLREGHHLGNHKRELLLYGTGSNVCHHPSYYDQPQLCDYISVDKEECYCYSPPPQTKNNHNPTAFGRWPSPRYGDDTPHTILNNNLDTTQSITAIFMGFQAAEDDSSSPEYLGSLKAELIIIEDNEDDVNRMKSHSQLGISKGAVGENVGFTEGLADRQTETQMAQGIRKSSKHKPCCAVC